MLATLCWDICCGPVPPITVGIAYPWIFYDWMDAVSHSLNPDQPQVARSPGDCKRIAASLATARATMYSCPKKNINK